MHQHNKELIIVEERNKTGKNKHAATDIKSAINHGIAVEALPKITRMLVKKKHSSATRVEVRTVGCFFRRKNCSILRQSARFQQTTGEKKPRKC